MVKSATSAVQNYRLPDGTVDLERYVDDTGGAMPPKVKSQALETVRVTAKGKQVIVDLTRSSAKPGDSLVIALLRDQFYGGSWEVKNKKTPQLEKSVGADGTITLTNADYRPLGAIHTVEVFGLSEDGGPRFTPYVTPVVPEKSDEINSGSDPGAGDIYSQKYF